jgi:hypothetical protein
MEDFYTEKEIKAIKTLITFRLPEPIAKNCINSRNAKELEIIMEFLDRYGHYIKN